MSRKGSLLLRRRSTTRPVVLLGPQRHAPSVDRALADLGITGQVATVTAGWEEREDEDQELHEHLGARTVNLRLYQRAEDVFQKDPALLEGMREWRDALRERQALYRLRLGHGLAAVRELFAVPAPGAAQEAECESALQAVRDLDAHHLESVVQRTEAAEADFRYAQREAIASHADELRQLLRGCEALLVAGGHVAVLRNRLRMFGLLDLIAPDLPVVAWSAGAMALSQRVILFHDSPPQGPGDAEIVQAGLGEFEGVVPLPHASHRLRLDEPQRVRLFARRFGPDLCVAFDPGARLDREPSGWRAAGTTRRLAEDGTVPEMGGV